MSRERVPTGNILAMARSRDAQAKEVEDDATSYMPTSVDFDTLMPDSAFEEPGQVEDQGSTPVVDTPPDRKRRHVGVRKAQVAENGSVKRKRISLYLEDDVLTKIFHVSLERHEQLSTATHRLIVEALKARGL